jgi:SAM-dependent methyltransferase
MSEQLELVTPLHTSTKRDCLARMNDGKVEAMKIAKLYEKDYWDGDRKFGYGGYRYIPGRWKPVAEVLVERYKLNAGSKVLDVGFGKGFLLYELQLLNPEIELFGIDISKHGLSSIPSELRAELLMQKAQEKYPWPDNTFDLVFSLATLHNLHLPELDKALREIERVGKQGFIMVESFRNEEEQFNLECWALTAETIINTESWKWLFANSGYSGDYEFIYF